MVTNPMTLPLYILSAVLLGPIKMESMWSTHVVHVHVCVTVTVYTCSTCVCSVQSHSLLLIHLPLYNKKYLY